MIPYFEDGNIRLFNCEVMEGLRAMKDESVQCCVTSPPYWGLRDYGVQGQIGLEKTPEEYIEKLVRVFREVRRVLKNDGTLWINIGDSYAKDGMPGGHAKGTPGKIFHGHNPREGDKVSRKIPPGYKPKDLIGVPWMLAFALRSDGWYLRQDIIWSKPNPMPESVQDRCTKSHEYIFLLSKSKNYYYDSDAIREPFKDVGRFHQDIENQAGSTRTYGKTNGNMKARGDIEKGANKRSVWSIKERGHKRAHQGFNNNWDGMSREEQQANGSNKRSVWNIAPNQYKEAHFATFPPALIRPCILAGSREGDTILDTFFGSGVTGEVSRDHGRKCDGIELHPDYCELSMKRFKQGILNFI